MINLKRNKSKVGLPPGSLVFSGTERSHNISIEHIAYSTNKYFEEAINSIKDIEVSPDSNNIHWINLNGLH